MTDKMRTAQEEPFESALPMECERALTDDELAEASGGGSGHAEPGDLAYISGSLYKTGYAEGYSGSISGYYYIQRYISGRAAPYLLKTNVGWVKESAVYI